MWLNKKKSVEFWEEKISKICVNFKHAGALAKTTTAGLLGKNVTRNFSI